MKPFTQVKDRYEVGKLCNVYLSTSTDGKRLYLDGFVYTLCTNNREIILDRPAAKWLIKQLKKALKHPTPSQEA